MENITTKENIITPVIVKEKQTTRHYPKIYSYANKWCEDCQVSYEEGCAKHLLIPMQDKKILPMAFSSLPEHLFISDINQKTTSMSMMRSKTDTHNDSIFGWEIQSSGGKFVRFVRGNKDKNGSCYEERMHENHYQDRLNFTSRGIFAGESIPSRTQFGPLVCRFMKESERVGPQTFPLLLDGEDGTVYLSNLSDPEACNWMMFVRPASTSTNQNLVAFQHNQQIFYVSIKNIEVGQELRVWYATPYAQRLGMALLQEPMKQESGSSKADYISETSKIKASPVERMAFLKPNTLEKNVRLANSIRRYKKINLIERKLTKDMGCVEDESVKLEMSEEIISDKEHDNDDDDYHPKQEKISSWSRKCKRRKRAKHPPLNKSSKYKGCASSREWLCQQCDLVFNDPSVLNLHTLAHAAEDVGFMEAEDDNGTRTDATLLSDLSVMRSQPPKIDGQMGDLLSLMTLTCPVCSQDFETKTSLVLHVGQHGSSRQSLARPRPFKCQMCFKTFSLFERLQQHLICHGDESLKPMACEVCKRRFMNPAALAVHMKTHGDRKYYTCPLCPESFDQIQKLRAHAEESHLERTIKSFDPMIEKDILGSRDMEKNADSNTTDGLSSGSTFSRDATCAGVAIATATNAITSEIWMGTCRNKPDPSSTVDVEGELQFDEGSNLFAEEDALQTTSTNLARGNTELHIGNIIENKNTAKDEKCARNKVVPSTTEGTYHCPECHRVFTEFSAISRHVRLFHSSRIFECKDCGRTFPRRDKLRLHTLRHSNHREFVCETCGRQFKRKDKLRDHLRRQHDPAKGNDFLDLLTNKKDSFIPSFKPEISPLDFMKFVFKCQKCLLGFKRRGMLVNHMAKKHPDISIDSIPELNLPIITSRHDFFCQYCNKVFKSSSKRKFHILKHHPGLELPASLRPRKKPLETFALKNYRGSEVLQPNSSYSTPSGHLASGPHSCDMCHRQYTSKSKLFQHQRKKHPSCGEGAKAKSSNFSDELGNTSTSHQVPSNSTNITINTISQEMDYSELFVSAPIFFTPKGTSSLEFTGETDLTTAGSVLVLSNEDELLMQGTTQLSFAKALQPNFVGTQAQASIAKPQQHQTVIIDPDIFAQTMNELTKSYVAKNSVLLTHYEAQQPHYSSEGIHPDMVSLAIESGTKFDDQKLNNAAQLMQVTSNAGTTTIMSSPYISVVEYEHLCSSSPPTS